MPVYRVSVGILVRLSHICPRHPCPLKQDTLRRIYFTACSTPKKTRQVGAKHIPTTSTPCGGSTQSTRPRDVLENHAHQDSSCVHTRRHHESCTSQPQCHQAFESILPVICTLPGSRYVYAIELRMRNRPSTSFLQLSRTPEASIWMLASTSQQGSILCCQRPGRKVLISHPRGF